MQLTTEHTEKHIDSKRETSSFCDFPLCVQIELNYLTYKKHLTTDKHG